MFLVEYLPITNTARVEEEGHAEFRGKLNHDKSATELVGEVEYGIADRVQVKVEVPWVEYHGQGSPDDGVPAVEFGAGVALLRDTRELAASLGAVITAPVEDHDTKYEVFGALTRRFGPVEVYGSGGVEWTSSDDETFWSLAAVTTVPGEGRVHPTLEWYGRGSATWIAPGVVYCFRDGLEAALGVPLGVGGDSESVGLALSFFVEF